MNLRDERDIPGAAASPVVTVMARRLGVFASFAHPSESAVPEAEKPDGTRASVAEPRVPQVFLIGDAKLKAAERADQSAHTAEMNPAVLLLEQRGVHTPVMRTSSKRERNRAAPVTVIYSATLATQRAESRHPLNGGKPSADDPTQRNAASLAKTLSELEPILAAIHTAMASRLDAPAVANGWQRLFVAAKSITNQLAR